MYVAEHVNTLKKYMLTLCLAAESKLTLCLQTKGWRRFFSAEDLSQVLSFCTDS